MGSWWAFLLLAGAAYRIYRLIGQDTILDGPRARLLRLGNWREGQRVPAGYRSKLGEFIVCPWCLGFWVVLCWWLAWRIWPHGTLIVAFPFALSTAVGLIAQLGNPD